MRSSSERAAALAVFLEDCRPGTVALHAPIKDLAAVEGRLNPARLGLRDAAKESCNQGQSSVGFPSLDSYRDANEKKLSPYRDGAEYAIVRSAEAAAACRKMAELHEGAGAIIVPNGLNAITTALMAFPHSSIAVPEGVYSPVRRFVAWFNELNPNSVIKLHFYASDATKDDVREVIQSAKQMGSPLDLFYLEAPSSHAFEIPDLRGIVDLAAANGIRTLMDNSWATHARFKPLPFGIDGVIQATTKYEGGYYDTPSGVVVAKHPGDLERLEIASRALGAGTVSPELCERLLERIGSTEERLDQHFDTASGLIRWFQAAPFIDRVLSPALPSSKSHERFSEYFGKGNGSFTVLFKKDVAQREADAFMDALHLFVVAESWGGHVSLVLPVSFGDSANAHHGPAYRLHAGIEHQADLLRDLTLASEKIFEARVATRPEYEARVPLFQPKT